MPRIKDEPIYHASQVLLAYDLLCQTTQIRGRDDVIETNPLMSSNPSTAEVLGYWAVAALLHHQIYSFLERRDRRWAQAWAAAVAVNQSAYVYRNEANHQMRCW